MKPLAAAIGALVISLTLLPVVLAGGDAAPVPPCGVPAGPIAVILRTIRTLESGSNYTARATGSSASGAYQFIDGTWENYGGYRSAADAPPPIQDAKAAEHVTGILDAHSQDVSAVPVVWYIGHLPAADSPAWDRIPAPGAGNRLTPREYQARWLTTYERLLAQSTSEAPTDVATDAPDPGGCFGTDIEPLPGGWSLPGPRHLIDAEPSVLDQPHHDYPAWDWIIPADTPIYAVRGGTVSAVRNWPHNWYDAGCATTRGSGCDTCGIGLTITDAEGNRWTYCHGTALTIAVGSPVEAGNQIMWSGNTGRSGTAHLHLEIRTPDGARRCPQVLLHALASGIEVVSPHDLPRDGCSF